MSTQLLSTSHHRNGICGDPFDVTLFKDDDGTVKLCVDFGGMAVAVLQVDKLAAGDVAFGSNSWRGDTFAEKVRALTKDASPAVSDGAIFVRWPKKGGE